MKDASADLATVFRWWEAHPRCGIGIHCEASGLVVIDVDPRNGGDDSLWQLEDQLGKLPATPRALTGGGGIHVLLRNPGGGFRKEMAPGVDIKANGYIVAAPSRHPNGGSYEWEEAPGEVPLADVPAAWLERMTAEIRRHTPTLRESDDPLKLIDARTYFERLTMRSVDDGGWAQCPFHKGGQERTPSLFVRGTLWACYACEPFGGRRAMGGNVYDLAALLWGFPVPLRGHDFGTVRERLKATLL